MTAQLIEHHELAPGDLLFREVPEGQPSPPGWTRIRESRIFWRTFVPGDAPAKGDTAVRRSEPAHPGDMSVVPFPEGQPWPLHDRDDPCSECGPWWVWHAAWWEDDDA